jgi:single-stranded-DNA-specific exonuclease
MDAWDVAFKLAPRLNAAGRLGSARRAVDLLMTDDAAEALRIAQELDRENARRQRLQQQIQDEAVAMIERSGGLDGRLGVVVASPDWHAGVVGVVAGRLAEQTARPSVVIALQGDTGRGSARSGGGGVDLFDVLTECRDALIEFGGHADAAGLCVAADRVDLFRERFEAALRARLGGKDPVPVLDVEIEARLLWLTEDLAREVERLKPFGPGNEDPVFASAGVRVAAPPQRVGVGSRHLAFWVRQDGIGRRAIAFHMADMADAVGEGDVCAIAYVPCITVMRGERQVELRVLDIKPGDMP